MKKTEDRCAPRQKTAALQENEEPLDHAEHFFLLSSVFCLAAQRSFVYFLITNSL